MQKLQGIIHLVIFKNRYGGFFIMMMWLRNPRNVKTITLAVAAIFVVSVFIMGANSMTGQASAAPASSIAVVDMERVRAQSTDFNDAVKKFQDVQIQAEEDFKKNGANLSDVERQKYQQQLIERIKKSESDISSAWDLKLSGAVKKAADSKGYNVVVAKDNVLYGGSDITDEVIKVLNSK